jgi:L-aspartate semialdehyde sulfurtransferase
MAKTYDEINERIRAGKAVVVTAEEIVGMVAEDGAAKVAKKVDVVTTATFGPMCSSGAFLNFGHSDPPIKMSKIWLNDVPAYAGLAAVDAYIGATELSETRGLAYGGAHVIQDLIDGKAVRLRVQGYPTDCYPRAEIDTWVSKETLNQAYLFNPRNAYQNYAIAVNTSNRTLYTYMGTLLPNLGNATYSTSGQLSPLLNDPLYRTIGIGTRLFLAGAKGYVAWEGTQHNPKQARAANDVPLSSAGTLALIGDLKEMDSEFIHAASFHNYGTTLFMGVGIPIPMLDEEVARQCGVSDADIEATIVDYSVPQRSRPSLGRATYAQLKTGQIKIGGKKVPTGPLSSYLKARKIASVLKEWVSSGGFEITEPVERLSLDRAYGPLEVRSEEEASNG